MVTLNQCLINNNNNNTSKFYSSREYTFRGVPVYYNKFSFLSCELQLDFHRKWCNGHVYTILYIFYRFTKDAVIHQLKEVFLKVVFRFSSQLGVKVYILFQPRALFKLNTSVNFCDFQTDTLVQF